MKGGLHFKIKYMKRYFLNSIWLSFTLVICITLKKFYSSMKWKSFGYTAAIYLESVYCYKI